MDRPSTSLCAYLCGVTIWVGGQPINYIGGSRYDRSQNPCRPLCGGAYRYGCRGIVPILYGVGGVRCGLCGADPACRGAGQTVGGIVFLVLAFLVSPYGIPAVAEWLVDKLHSLNYALRGFITG